MFFFSPFKPITLQRWDRYKDAQLQRSNQPDLQLTRPNDAVSKSGKGTGLSFICSFNRAWASGVGQGGKTRKRLVGNRGDRRLPAPNRRQVGPSAQRSPSQQGEAQGGRTGGAEVQDWACPATPLHGSAFGTQRPALWLLLPSRLMSLGAEGQAGVGTPGNVRYNDFGKTKQKTL